MDVKVASVGGRPLSLAHFRWRASSPLLSPSLRSSASWALGGVVGLGVVILCVKTVRSENTSESEEVTGLSDYLQMSRENVQDAGV